MKSLRVARAPSSRGTPWQASSQADIELPTAQKQVLINTLDESGVTGFQGPLSGSRASSLLESDLAGEEKFTRFNT